MLTHIKCYLAFAMVIFFITPLYAQNPEIKVNLKSQIAEMRPVWAWFGYDEPNYTYMKDG
ncbi:MAG: beta-xylosidase, partial [Pedobacter sp.]